MEKNKKGEVGDLIKTACGALLVAVVSGVLTYVFIILHTENSVTQHWIAQGEVSTSIFKFLAIGTAVFFVASIFGIVVCVKELHWQSTTGKAPRKIAKVLDTIGAVIMFGYLLALIVVPIWVGISKHSIGRGVLTFVAGFMLFGAFAWFLESVD